ncbi:hypothetical protein ACH40E_40380 [Streptomyces acidicola]|uniref:hypothetical protein n=1 Tax=Streptomyces acidicola TaxID=2596892 RepID=UPI0037A47C85
MRTAVVGGDARAAEPDVDTAPRSCRHGPAFLSARPSHPFRLPPRTDMYAMSPKKTITIAAST